MTDRYYYYLLNADCRILYDRLLDGIKKRCDKVLCKDLSVCIDDVPLIISAVEYDNPDLFYVDFSKSQFCYSNESKKASSISIEYLYSVTDTFALQAIVDSSCKAIISKTSIVGCSDLQKLWKVHDFLIDNVDYFQEVLTQKGSFEWYRASSILGLFLDKKAICSGISRALKYILNQIGLRAIVVAGFAIDQNNKKVGHEWNIVSISGKKYHLDMTWDITESVGTLRSYNYFNLNDELIFKDHYTDSVLPECKDNDENYFERKGAVIHGKKDWVRYFNTSHDRLIGDYYVRFTYPCDLNHEVKRIEELIVNRRKITGIINLQSLINERQSIVRVVVKNG